MKRAVSAHLVLLFTLSLFVSITPIMDFHQETEGELSLAEIQDLMDESPDDLGINETAITQTAQEMMMSSFQENLGQIDNEDVLFYGRIPRGMIGFGISEVFIWLENTTSSIVLTFEGANAVVPKQNQLEAHSSNYFLGDRGTFTGVSSSQIVLYENLWFGIDLQYEATPQGAKYEFHVAPGVDPHRIRVHYSGHDALLFTDDSLTVLNQGQLFRDDGLVVNQGDIEIKASFIEVESNIIGIDVGEYDPTQELVIDPLVYSTYLGGSQYEGESSIGIDQNGSIYVAGTTMSTNFPTIGQSVSPIGLSEITFVTKFNSSGNEMIYSTFVGGSNGDEFPCMVVDASGFVYVAGTTNSPDFPTVNAYDDTWHDSADGFVFKLNQTGNGLIFSTYVGGSDEEYPYDIDIDDEANVYLVGATESFDFPLINWMDNETDGAEAFLLRFNSTGNGLDYSTYIGGSSPEDAIYVTVDSSKNVYIVGYTYSTDFVTLNAYQPSNAGLDDGYIMKVNSTGNGLVYSTYIGGSDSDYLSSVAVDADGNVYVAGHTMGEDFPTQNPYDSTLDGLSDIIVLKLNATGNGLVYSTYFGGSNDEWLPKIAVNDVGETYVSVFTNSPDVPMKLSYDDSFSGTSDIVVFKLNSLGNELEYSTYIGGSQHEDLSECATIIVDSQNYVYFACSTSSSDFPMVEAYNSTYGGNADCGVFKLADNSDSDNDLLGDYHEDLYGTDKFDPDSDDDNLRDGDEVFQYLTDPLNKSDPGWINALNYSTYITGSDSDSGGDIAIDELGYIYATGVTASNNFPLLNPYDSTQNGNYDIFVLKLTPDGSSLVYSTYIGGAAADYGYAISVDYLGFAYIAGDTISSDFPTVDAYSSTNSGYYDSFVLKLNQIGNDLVFSTYVGGSDDDNTRDMVMDSIGNIYVCGTTGSADYPVMNAFDSTLNGTRDGYIYKMASDGSSLLYSTFIGGSDQEFSEEIEIDNNNCAVVSGLTYSTDFPTYSPLFGTYNGALDTYIIKFNATGNGLLFSTYLGGSTFDYPGGLALDSQDNVIIAGYTQSSNFPIYNAVQSTYGGGVTDLYIAKLTSDGGDLLFSTFYGGSDAEHPRSIVCDHLDNIYISGQVDSLDFPLVHPYDSTQNGLRDTFLIQMANSGSIIYSTYIGGSERDNNAFGIVVDLSCVAYVVGQTRSDDFPLVDPFQSSQTGITSVFVFKLRGTGDSDNDTLDDLYEFSIGLNPGNNDSDFDNLSDGLELFIGTNPLNNDSDSDLMPDDWEYNNGLDPNHNDATDDLDLDLLSNYLEYQIGTEPNNNDTDSDLLLDSSEYLTHGTDPLNYDSDFDLMPDGWEIANSLDPLTDDAYDDYDFDLLINLFEWENGTLANNNDTDSDLMPDGWEINNGLNATLDDASDDFDTDTLSNLGEYQNGTLPWDPDCDSDNLLDGAEILIHGTNPLSPHSDTDIMPDGWEVLHSLNPLVDDSSGDPDTDLLINEDEYTWGTDPHNPDSDFDTFTDGDEVHNLGSDPMNPNEPDITTEPIVSTFIGGGNSDTGYAIEIDSQGYVYLSGQTYSSDFPTVGAYDATYNGGTYDAFLLKFDPIGSTLVFSTFLGGSARERGYFILIEPSGNILLSGWTESSDFPTVNAFDSSRAGGYDGFLCRFNADGDTLLYSTFIGGSGEDYIRDIQLTDDGHLVCFGATLSSNFPVVNAYDSTYNGGRDAVVLKFSPALDSLVFSTYLGGSGEEHLYGGVVDADGYIYASGRTASSNYPMLNAYDSTYAGASEIFLTKFNTTGNSLIYSTFYGGNGEEYFGRGGIPLDGYLYLGGSTGSTDFPTINAYDSTPNGNWDAFVIKVDPSDGTPVFSTYIGGNGQDIVYGVDVDQWGNTYLTGPTTSTNLPIVEALYNTSSGGEDGFLFKLNSTGNGLKYSGYYGGSSNDGPRCLRVDAMSRVYLTGWTQSSNFPMFNEYDGTLSGGDEMFLMVMPALADQDEDGIDDDVELRIGTNRFSNDSDSDLMPDGWEYFYGLDPTLNDSTDDLDLDLLSNYLEYSLGTLPNNNDTDSDFLLDGLEYHTYSSDPFNSDSDLDTLLDGIEVLIYGTSPTNNDTDSDLMPDDWEINYGLKPLVDDALDDNDTDYLNNLDEYNYGTNPFNPDTDSDSVMDGIEVHYLGSDPTDPYSFGNEPAFSTGMGGGNSDEASSIKIGPSGEIYVSGHTYSSDFPTLNAYDSTHNSQFDCFVLKLSSDGQTLLYSTYIGGSTEDIVKDMVIDSSGNAIVTGYTQSSNFPTVNAIDASLNGARDCIVFMLNPTGDELLFSTYYGGGIQDRGYGIAVNATGHIYIGGWTDSGDLPTPNGYDTVFNGGSDIFILCLTPDGQSVVFCTYFGGSGNDILDSIHVNVFGEVIISGETSSVDYPLVNPVDPILEGAMFSDGFITRFDTIVDNVQFSSYLGGGEEEPYCYTISDSEGNLFVAGTTISPDFPVLNALNSSINGGADIFVTKINTSDLIEYSTFIGGSSDEYCRDAAIDDTGNLYLIGNTFSVDFPYVKGFNVTYSGGSDAFICVIQTNPLEVKYSSYYGGMSLDVGSGVYYDGLGNVLVAGHTDSIDFPLYNELMGINPPVDTNVFIAKLPIVLDQDGDGLSDVEETIIGTNPINPDTDSDLMTDGWEYYNGLDPLVDDAAGDLDSDTLSNLFEFNIGTLPNTNDTDSDTMLDAWEYYNGLNPTVNDAAGDLDSDGLTNIQEFGVGSNPDSGDSDSDLMPDLWEYTYGLNLTFDDAGDDLDSDSLSNLDEYLNGCLPNNGDTDADALGDYAEVVTYGTNPLAPDSDLDLLEDGYEVLTLGSDPLSTDTDSDQLSDGFEVLQFGTDPTLADTDGDSMTDYEEYLAGTNPLVADADADADGDGLTNKEEWEAGTDIFDSDTDHDGISDLYDPTPLRYDVPTPWGELTIVGAIVGGSLIPALVVVLMNEKMFRRMSKGKPKDEKSQEGDA